MRNDRLGDTILALPVITSLRRLFPHVKLTFLAAPSIAPLIACAEGVDEVLEADDSHSRDILAEMSRLRIDMAFCLRPTWQNAIFLYKSGIPIRVGTSRRWFSFLFNKYDSTSRRNSGLHETELNLKMLIPFGGSSSAEFPAIHLPASIHQSTAMLLTSLGVEDSDRIVVLHPGSGGSARNWPVQYFRELGHLLQQSGYRVVITGSVAEKPLCEDSSQNNFVVMAGKTDLLGLAALLSRASIVVAGSTGPLHLAVALGRPVVGLYPRLRDCLPERWGPYLHPEWALSADHPVCKHCEPGLIGGCRCMEMITSQEVYEKALVTLSRSGSKN